MSALLVESLSLLISLYGIAKHLNARTNVTTVAASETP
jgi:hypothetical protein